LRSQAADGKSCGRPAPGRSPLAPELWARVADSLALSPQQARLVELLLGGLRDKDIAASMGVGLPTVRTYFERVFRRVGVTDRVQLVIRVMSVALQESSRCHQSR
jgi:DNA-binding NarL/FixJ family response regulator